MLEELRESMAHLSKQSSPHATHMYPPPDVHINRHTHIIIVIIVLLSPGRASTRRISVSLFLAFFHSFCLAFFSELTFQGRAVLSLSPLFLLKLFDYTLIIIAIHLLLQRPLL